MNLWRTLDPYPFFRLTIPLVTGIFLSYIYSGFSLNKEIFVGIGIGLLFGMVITIRLQAYRYRWLFGFFLYSLLFLLGAGLYQYHKHRVVVDWGTNAKVYRGVLVEQPVSREKSIRCRINTIHGDIYLYLSKDSSASSLLNGDEVVFYSKIEKNRNSGYPYEFDYATYLYNQGISGTAFAFAHQWKKTGNRAPLNWKQQALTYRNKILHHYGQWGLDSQVENVLSALTVGYKDYLTEETKDQYAAAGISHVLALSGLHVGILWGLISLLLLPFKTFRGGNLLRWLMMNMLLWGYAFLAGLSASIVRAVIMCLFVELGKLRSSRTNSLNLLAVAAFFMLLYNPFYLFDVGFQLSFLAVFSIVVCFPALYQKFAPKHKLSKFLVSTLGISFTAQLGVAPLVIYYFSSFPIYFLFSNLVVSPLVCCIMYLALFSLLLYFVPTLQTIFVSMLGYSIHLLNTFASWVSGLPGASVSNIYLNTFEVLLIYIFMVAIFCYMSVKRVRTLIFGLLIVTLFCGELCIQSFPRQTQPSIWFYQLRNHVGIHFINPDNTSYLVTSDSTLMSFEYLKNSFWKRKKLVQPEVLVDSVEHNDVWMKKGIVHWRDIRLGFINNNEWMNQTTDIPLSLDYLYITKGYTGTLKQLLTLFQCETVIVDGLLSKYRKAKIEEECRQQGVKFIDLYKEGSLNILQEIKN